VFLDFEERREPKLANVVVLDRILGKFWDYLCKIGEKWVILMLLGLSNKNVL